MSVPNRQTRRDRLKALLVAAGVWQEVYDHQPKSFQGQSPVATVHGGPVDFPLMTFGGDEDAEIELWVTNFVKRDDAAAAEDSLDALLLAVGDVVVANRKDAGFWNELFLRGPTEPDYPTIDGVQYRSELVRVVATVYV